jgi:hypothetical protein
MIKQITVNGGPWLPPKEELITKHLQAFLSFVKLIDFQKLTSSCGVNGAQNTET